MENYKNYLDLLDLWENKITDEDKYEMFLTNIRNIEELFKEVKITRNSLYNFCFSASIPTDFPKKTIYDIDNNISICSGFKLIHKFKSEMRIYLPTLMCLLNTLEFIKNENKESLFSFIQDAAVTARLNVDVSVIDGNIILLPKGAKILDDVIKDNLGLLHIYPKAFKEYGNAIRLFLEDKYQRSMLDHLRISLEILIKEKLRTKKSLANSLNLVLRFFDDNGIHVQIRNMYHSLIKSYDQYHNDTSKHDNKARKNELEFILYLTSTFMRLLLIADKDR